MDFGNKANNNNNNFNKINNNKTDYIKPTKSIFNFPKIEMAARKEANKIFGNDNWDIEILMSKYIPKSLSENFNQMSDEYKNKFFYTLRKHYTNISHTGGNIAELLNVSGKLNNYLNNSSFPQTSNIRTYSPIIEAGYDSNIEEENIDEDVDRDPIYSEFLDYSNLYSEEVLIEASMHYYKAEKLIERGKHLKALEEFKIVKQIIPEKSELINDNIIMIINPYTVKDNNKEYYYGEKIKALNESLEIALKTNNDLCYLYQELASAYGELKNYNKRIECLKKATDLAGYGSIYGHNLALTYKEIGLYDEALKIFKYIKENAPSFAKVHNINIDSLISEINVLKHSKMSNNTKTKQLDFEHSRKGDEYFNKKEYEKAFSEYDAAYRININEISYLIKKIMVKEMFECPYYGLIGKLGCILYYFEEIELVSQALWFCEEKGEYNYLPFLYTLCGDYCRYEDIGIRGAEILYGLAVDLLNMVPANEKFAAPYYKLARIKEQLKKYDEALTLCQYANIIDKTYDIQKDINRLESAIKDGGKNNSIEANKLIAEMIKCCKSGAFSEVIQKGKIASEYDPDNATIYYLICCAAEIKNDYYNLKWAAKEGFRAYRYNSNQYMQIEYLYFYFWLGKCCKFENKQKQASYYFQLISEIDDDIEKVVTKKALNEISLMTCGRKLYEDVN